MNIAEILKDCPKGTKLYSPIFGSCTLDHVKGGIYKGYDDVIYVNVEFACCKQYAFNSEGQFFANTNTLGECLLFPTKENRNWSNFKTPKKENLCLKN